MTIEIGKAGSDVVYSITTAANVTTFAVAPTTSRSGESATIVPWWPGDYPVMVAVNG